MGVRAGGATSMVLRQVRVEKGEEKGDDVDGAQ